MFNIPRLAVAFVVAAFVVPAFAFAVTPRALAAHPAGTYPTADACAAAEKNRAKTDGPGCTVIVECPADSVGCELTASMTIASRKTNGPAQGRLRLTDQHTGAFVDSVCSSSGTKPERDAGCSATAGPIYVAAGSVWAATCTWIGNTVSQEPRLTCEARMVPFGQG